jgi:hypothetical protein
MDFLISIHNCSFQAFFAFDLSPLMPLVVRMISPSKIMYMDGRKKMTANILTMAPLAISRHRELIKSTSE